MYYYTMCNQNNVHVKGALKHFWFAECGDFQKLNLYSGILTTGCLTLKGDFWTHDSYVFLDDNYLFQILDVHFDPET